MALRIAADQFALHSSSKKFSDGHKAGIGGGGWNLYANPSDGNRQLKIPSTDIFQDQGQIDQSGHHDALPSIAECAIHLEFLAVLHELHRRVVESTELDELFDIQPTHVTVTRKGVPTRLKDNTLLARKEAKWDRFVELAAVRFLAWWNAVPEIHTCDDSENIQCTDLNLPPLDILMVWHSFLLNPRWYRKNCAGGKKLLYKINFPWRIIHQRINSDNWTFSLSTLSWTTFHRATSLAPDLYANLLGWKLYDTSLRQRLIEFSPTSVPFETQETIKPTDLSLMQCISNMSGENRTELVDAVKRQIGFVDKMWDKIWIRSPALDGTIRRAQDRYSNFLKLFKLYPTTMLVPTLDIDLVWHTHQCAPRTYYNTTQEIAGRFVNHDDSIVQAKLTTGMAETTGLYRMRFGREYHVCGCWDCEALQSAIEEVGRNIRKGEEPDWDDIAMRMMDDVTYYRTVEVARRTKKPLPFR